MARVRALTGMFHRPAKASINLSVGRRCRAAQISGRSGSFALPSYEISGLKPAANRRSNFFCPAPRLICIDGKQLTMDHEELVIGNQLKRAREIRP
jgi:hypothetical protein